MSKLSLPRIPRLTVKQQLGFGFPFVSFLVLFVNYTLPITASWATSWALWFQVKTALLYCPNEFLSLYFWMATTALFVACDVALALSPIALAGLTLMGVSRLIRQGGER